MSKLCLVHWHLIRMELRLITAWMRNPNWQVCKSSEWKGHWRHLCYGRTRSAWRHPSAFSCELTGLGRNMWGFPVSIPAPPKILKDSGPYIARDASVRRFRSRVGSRGHQALLLWQMLLVAALGRGVWVGTSLWRGEYHSPRTRGLYWGQATNLGWFLPCCPDTVLWSGFGDHPLQTASLQFQI